MALFEKGNSTRCDLCGFDLGTTEGLDAHEGRHAGADPQAFKVGFMPGRKFHPHPDDCKCARCKEIQAMIADQKREYWATLNAA
jgi:rubredoxin